MKVRGTRLARAREVVSLDGLEELLISPDIAGAVHATVDSVINTLAAQWRMPPERVLIALRRELYSAVAQILNGSSHIKYFTRSGPASIPLKEFHVRPGVLELLSDLKVIVVKGKNVELGSNGEGVARSICHSLDYGIASVDPLLWLGS